MSRLHNQAPGRFVLLCVVTFLSPSQRLLAADNVLRVGSARVDITPTTPVTLAGYESRKDLSQGVHDPLSARAIAFEKAGKHLVLISLDSLGFYNATAEPLRQAILDACKLEPSELFLAAIHTHSAPSLVLDPAKGNSNNVAYTEALTSKLAGAARQAIEHARLAKLQIASGSSPVGANRRLVSRDAAGNPKIVLGRNPSLLTDREVQVLKVSGENESDTIGILFDYSTHSTSLGPRNYLVSGDVHGLAQQFIEKYYGADVVAAGFAGASGNIDPWYRVLPDFRTNNGWIPEPVLLGTLLGEEVVHVVEEMTKTEPNDVISTAFETLVLPGKPPDELVTTTNCPPTSLNLTVARVGQVAFVGLGGEVFHEIGQAIKSASPFPHTIIITHCNGAAGYLPTRPAYLEGGYEVRSSRFGPDAADEVIREAVHLLHAL